MANSRRVSSRYDAKGDAENPKARFSLCTHGETLLFASQTFLVNFAVAAHRRFVDAAELSGSGA